ncbi:hypothetical protein [Christiangramia forsetii]|uniref:Uncharacterized protein n=2 Tax=Christiangramia forsetii TaxID=411153 RepID=A0M1S4_CHRFK|nr:hypothetical protein [Christiangramia forsetii]GGG45489.1 hypothetical protein GCM10011532_31850 [Christiangramia forsetii]CAL66569.1 hypothetical protein GFO_1596 [Christiangramia forsetii KT0803]
MQTHPNSVLNIVPDDSVKEIHHLDFGDIIFLDQTIITELYEGITYGWEQASQVIVLAEKSYGQDFYVNYISNRLHDYSVVAQDWSKFFKQNRQLRSFCIVTHSKTGTTNIAVERIFYKEGNIMHFTDLSEALKFTGNLKN